MILGAHGRDLPLRRAVGLHVPAAHGRVDRHELAVGLVGLRARRRHDALAHPHQRRVVLLGARDVPAALEDGEGLHLVGDVHLLAAERERDVGGTGLEALHREVEARTARGAGILDVVDGNALDADLAEDDLARESRSGPAAGHWSCPSSRRRRCRRALQPASFSAPCSASPARSSIERSGWRPNTVIAMPAT